MAVIDLSTGAKVKDAATSQENVPTTTNKAPEGKIINLDTGKFEPKPLMDPREQYAQTTQFHESKDNWYKPSQAEKDLPEITTSGILSGENPADIAKVSAAILVTPNPREIGNILSSTFPHIGVTEDENGNLIAGNNKTGVQAIINKKGASPLDVLQVLGVGTAFTPAAQAAAIPAALGSRVAIGAAGSGLTQGAIEGIQKSVGGELNPEEIAIATALGGAVETVVPAINAMRNARQSREVRDAVRASEDVAGNVQTARDASNATGIDLFQAQQTAIPAQIERQSFLTQLPASTQTASNALSRQNQQAFNAVDNFLSQIAPDNAVVAGQERIRTAAQEAISVRNRARAEASSPIYKQAFRRQRKGQVGPINTDALETKIEQMSRQFSRNGQIRRELNTALNSIREADGNLQKLHLAKTEIDQTINSFGQNSVGNTTRRFLSDVKRDLVDDLVSQSPSYRAARDEFIRTSPPVKHIRESIIGKVAELTDTQLDQASTKIFNPAQTNHQVVRNARQMIESVDPDAWGMILRSELERRLGSIKTTAEAGTTENIPGQLFNAIFGNTKQRNVLYSALDNEQRNNLRYLQTALNRARLGRGAGSQTAIREEMKRELRGGVGSAIRTFFKGPVRALAETGEDAAFNQRTRALADVMFDPQWRQNVRELRRLDSNSPAAGRALIQLLDDAMATDLKNTEGNQ